MEHDLKIWPVYFESIANGLRTCEVRKDDRQFMPGDLVHLREWNPETTEYTGRVVSRRITYVLRDSVVVAPGYAVLSLQLIRAEDAPGDCYFKRVQGEPAFTLLGRDPMAPSLVEAWAHARQQAGETEEKIAGAIEIAEKMRAFLGGTGKSEIVVR